MLGNHAMLFNLSSDLCASHDNGRLMLTRKERGKKREIFLTMKFSHSM